MTKNVTEKAASDHGEKLLKEMGVEEAVLTEKELADIDAKHETFVQEGVEPTAAKEFASEAIPRLSAEVKRLRKALDEIACGDDKCDTIGYGSGCDWRCVYAANRALFAGEPK